MRVLGLLLVFLGQPVWAAEDQVQVAFARFAYAGSSAFHSSLREQPPPEISTSLEKRLPFLPLDVFGKEHLVDQTPTAPLPLVKSADAKPTPPDDRIEVASTEPVAVDPVPAPANEPVVAAEPPPPAQRYAALPEPMHLLPRTPTAEIRATEVSPVVPKPHNHTTAKRSKPQPRATQQARPASQPAQKSAQAEAPSKIPRWAQQMFESNWQNRLFAYQR